MLPFFPTRSKGSHPPQLAFKHYPFTLFVDLPPFRHGCTAKGEKKCKSAGTYFLFKVYCFSITLRQSTVLLHWHMNSWKATITKVFQVFSSSATSNSALKVLSSSVTSQSALKVLLGSLDFNLTVLSKYCLVLLFSQTILKVLVTLVSPVSRLTYN